MNGDNLQTPDPNQAQGSWQYQPSNPAPPQQVVGQPMAPPAPAPQQYAQPAPQPFQQQNLQPMPEITWSASEYIAHEKDVRWYALFFLAVAGIVGLIYLITRDIFSSIVVFALAAFVAYSAGRKPHIITYKLDRHGLTIGDKFRPYSDFRSFAILQEEAFSTITMLPLRRFAVPISLYYDPKDEDAIITIISQHVPIEKGHHDPIDNLTRRIRF